MAIGVTGDAREYCDLFLAGQGQAMAMIGEPVPMFDELAEAIAEMGTSSGRAAIGLKCGYVCKLSPPTLVSGAGVVISTLDIQRLIIPLEMPLGYLEISVALRQVKPK